MRAAILYAGAVGSMVLMACTGDSSGSGPTDPPDPVAATVTVVETAAPVTSVIVEKETITVTETATETVTVDAIADEPEFSDNVLREIAMLALEDSWGSQNVDEREILCWGWEFDPEHVVDFWYEDANSPIHDLPKSEFRDFWNEKCAL